jgi:hypothetical protein
MHTMRPYLSSSPSLRSATERCISAATVPPSTAVLISDSGLVDSTAVQVLLNCSRNWLRIGGGVHRLKKCVI